MAVSAVLQLYVSGKLQPATPGFGLGNSLGAHGCHSNHGPIPDYLGPNLGPQSHTRYDLLLEQWQCEKI